VRPRPSHTAPPQSSGASRSARRTPSSKRPTAGQTQRWLAIARQPHNYRLPRTPGFPKDLGSENVSLVSAASSRSHHSHSTTLLPSTPMTPRPVATIHTAATTPRTIAMAFLTVVELVHSGVPTPTHGNHTCLVPLCMGTASSPHESYATTAFQTSTHVCLGAFSIRRTFTQQSNLRNDKKKMTLVWEC
jgi:hypothetical protein